MKAQFNSFGGFTTPSKAVAQVDIMQDALDAIIQKPCLSYQRAESNVLSFMSAEQRTKMLARRIAALCDYLGVSYSNSDTPEELARHILNGETRYVIEVAKQRKIKTIFGGSKND